MQTAKRGDLAVIVSTDRTFIIGQPAQERTRVECGVVRSITRDGLVRKVETVWGGLIEPRGQVLIAPAATIDVEVAMQIAREHHWPNHPGQPMPWDSVRECKESLRRAVLGTVYRDKDGHLRAEYPATV